MLEKPKLNMEIVVIPSSCGCDGFLAGTIGFIKLIETEDNFLVQARSNADSFWHCRSCVTKFK